MPTVWIETPHAKISLSGKCLLVEGSPETEEGVIAPRKRLREIPLRDVEQVACREDVSITARALAELLRNGIAVHLFSLRGGYLGCSLPAELPKGM